MVMCFMSVPCCGCVSQTERLTNCSILLNVRVMEAINGSELIAITHFAPCRCAIHNRPRRSSVEQVFDSESDLWSTDRLHSRK